ncbi:Gfo/Idh/MocA family protein [Sediminispirochaeta smaragdinae]|uniref:Inositol 2-dehydrogenase n=1 Tax=Sediminispirochaeta smaragdinae (strain DSM 11293 / JCM 15392 / SEBR 4228) TaxID=573413 RepID=E1R4E8_SEDSS|nr:Gfo/Idh/MocA family oxidoreductase [Sediminispirochaeta smaragdinae]ADK81689.1 Inositol 2-dehydrogenase [Sediminispirochaeta smaragdinae DSM 11293]
MSDLRIGIIGCGAIGQDHVKRINEKVQGATVTGIFEINEKVSRSLGESFGVNVFSSGEQLIESSEVDAVVVSSSDETHARYVLKAIEAKKFVFCEKPLTPKSTDGRHILDAEIAGGKQLVQVGFMRRYDPGYRAVRTLLQSGSYGSPLVLHCSHRNAAIPGFTTPMAIQSSASHEIDICRWLLGEEYVSCEVLMAKNSRHSGSDLHDPQFLILRTESGILITVEIFINCQYGYDINCEVVCEDGIVSLPSPPEVLVKNNGKKASAISSDWKARFKEAYEVEFQEWVSAVKQGRVGGPSTWDGYITAVVTEALSQARDTGERVPISHMECPDFYRKK